jgi:hypothetical protein
MPVRKLLGKSSSALSLIAFAGIVVLMLVFSGPVRSLTLTRAPPQTRLVATRPKLPAPPISEAGEGKRKTDSPQSVGTAPTPPNPSPTAPSSPSDEWSADEIKEELKECTRLLAPIRAEFEPEEPMKHRQCGAPAPIRLRALGEGETRVEFLPPVTVTCRLAAGLYRWIETSLQPAAREMLGSPITRISGQTYSCRHMYHNPRLPLSEHAKANAIDITRFATTVHTITVRRDWGPTERKLAEMQKRAAVAALKMGKAPEISSSIGDAAKKAQESQRGRLLKTVLKAEEALQKSEAASGKTEAAFLRRVHLGACGVLRTVLGPEANESHRDHLHLDMKARDSRICH